METGHKFPYRWTLKDAVFTKDKGKVFSCFACGGGSTMGYKLAGFDVIGCNEIDPKMMEAYVANHHPKYSYLEPIQTFKDRQDLPDDLFNLDILDGSPPCSSFSMAGNREKDWGKEKKFREGQSKQVLDTLFFDFIDLAKRLQPKVVIAENVKGILQGTARNYYRRVLKEMDEAGYYAQAFLLDASKMGVPQRRERVFFIGLRKDLAGPFLYQHDMFTVLPRLDLKFKERGVPFGEIEDVLDCSNSLTDTQKKHWEKTMAGRGFAEFHEKGHWFNAFKLSKTTICPTICAGTGNAGAYHYLHPRKMNDLEYSLASTFPADYTFQKNKQKYLMGMSVPPVMTAQIASRVLEQWLSKI
jgi:DNA (cytosine-5)-methyltransferase 1